MKFYSHLNTAAQLVQQYQGEQPFGLFLKSFFRLHKKYGSKDRKNISQLCYSFFRLGNSVNDLPVEEQIRIGLFLCADEPNELLSFFFPQWDPALSLEERIAFVRATWPPFAIDKIFTWHQSLSPSIDPVPFILSHLRQPDLFLRIRPGFHKTVIQKLEAAGTYALTGPDTVRLPNGFQADKLFHINKEVVIQDDSSQRVGPLMIDGVSQVREAHVWDCCAASGGKSIMAFDLLPGIELTVSDVRPSILDNLKQRFNEAGIHSYRSFVADLSVANTISPLEKADLIIADVPCTGSGTWSRTPGQLRFFNADKIAYYSGLQKKIIGNAIPHLQAHGRLLYITCSVFKEENEEMVQFILEKFQLQLLQMDTFRGYDKKADTLFAALFASAGS